MTAPIFIKDVWPDPHFEKIGEHFDLCSRAQLAEHRKALAEELSSLTSFYVICFTNRCGSNHLAQCLASDGRLMQAGEVLNQEAVINNALQHGFTSFDQYLTWLIKTQKGAHGVFGLKASAGQLLGLYNQGILELLGPRLKLPPIEACRPAMGLYTSCACATDIKAQAVRSFQRLPQVLAICASDTAEGVVPFWRATTMRSALSS